MDAITVVTSFAGAVLSGGGMSVIVGALAKRRSAPVDATVRLTGAAMAQVDQLQERVQEAERAAGGARQEAESAHREMQAVRREASELAGRLHSLIAAIHDPYMTLDRLRLMVPQSRNGAQL